MIVDTEKVGMEIIRPRVASSILNQIPIISDSELTTYLVCLEHLIKNESWKGKIDFSTCNKTFATQFEKLRLFLKDAPIDGSFTKSIVKRLNNFRKLQTNEELKEKIFSIHSRSLQKQEVCVQSQSGSSKSYSGFLISQRIINRILPKALKIETQKRLEINTIPQQNPLNPLQKFCIESLHIIDIIESLHIIGSLQTIAQACKNVFNAHSETVNLLNRLHSNPTIEDVEQMEKKLDEMTERYKNNETPDADDIRAYIAKKREFLAKLRSKLALQQDN